MLTIEAVLKRLPLFLGSIRSSKEVSDAIFLKLRAYIFRAGQNVSLDDILNYLTLTESLDNSFSEIAPCILNVLVHLRETQGTKASILRFASNYLT